MDGNRFDRLTRQLASGSSRRTLLKRSLAAAATIAGIGGAADASAARRPAPTPRPPRCPGIQVWQDGACACPSGEQCGPACCDAGSACCDGACCAGICYGEELCCPAGRLVCNGVCLDPGLCCVDTDCGPGFACQENQCVCVPASTCASQGIECGPATDDCGNALSCGDCAEPQTCGGGGTPGICGCTSQMTCEGRCGAITTECGAVLECGDACGDCQTCGDDHLCRSVEDGTSCDHNCTIAHCESGHCIDEFTIPCPGIGGSSDPCRTWGCVAGDSGPECRSTPSNEGGSCSPEAPCQTGRCSNGSCVGTEIQCPTCHACTTSTCEPVTGDSCGDGFQCVDGGCYAFSGGNDIVDDITADGMCRAAKCEKACCPGESGVTCCDSMDDCFLNGGSGFPYASFCCSPESKCGSDCCQGSETCVDGKVCRTDEQVCSDNAYCSDVCCGGNGTPGSGTCCSSTQQCHNGACVEVSIVGCNSDADCLEGSACNGVITQETTPGNVIVVQQGVCCLPEYSVGNPTDLICCGPGTYPSFTSDVPCCPWEGRNCSSCKCSTTSIRKWGR